jgi:SAM-dependent methyltransferase
MVASLEARGRTAGYLNVVGRLLEAAHLAPGEVVLEVGCGTGVLDRWLARRTAGANQIVGVDINPFLLREAMALARQEALEHRIAFREGNAEALPFPDDRFDVAMSSTVIQRVDADRMLAELAELNEGAGVLFKMRRDPRVTRVGAILRRYSVDELPQLFNVLTGSMSLVGPRPPLPEETARYEPDVRRRLLVKPGLTGLWQVSGRSDLSWEEAVRLDLRYVEDWSLAMDAMILWKTFRAVLGGQGAY